MYLSSSKSRKQSWRIEQVKQGPTIPSSILLLVKGFQAKGPLCLWPVPRSEMCSLGAHCFLSSWRAMQSALSGLSLASPPTYHAICQERKSEKHKESKWTAVSFHCFNAGYFAIHCSQKSPWKIAASYWRYELRLFSCIFPENSNFKELNTLLCMKALGSAFPPLALRLLLTLKLLVLPQEDLHSRLQIGFAKGCVYWRERTRLLSPSVLPQG